MAGHQRFRLGGAARMWLDSPSGPVSVNARVVELSPSGCQLLLARRVAGALPGRVGIDVAGSMLWLPVITRSVRQEPGGWAVACDFDRPTAEKQELVRELVGDLGSSPEGR